MAATRDLADLRPLVAAAIAARGEILVLWALLPFACLARRGLRFLDEAVLMISKSSPK
jgi:hypothetical protein